MRRLPYKRSPTHPGQVLSEEFLEPLGMTQREAATRLRISYPRMNEIVKGRRSVTPDTALRLGRLTDTEPLFWLNLQLAVDLWEAMHLESLQREVELIEPVSAA
jgi:antitoxin HigA-1